MRKRLLSTFLWLVLAVQPAFAQRLLEEWRVRTSAGPEALVTGATAVFWNPAMVRVERGRAEVSVLDLRAPRITGIDGVAAAGAVVVNEGRTTFGAGYEHVRVSGVEQTTTSPDNGVPLDISENRIAGAVSHMVGTRTRFGALVQYTRLPEITGEESVLALGAGVRHQPVAALPLQLAGMAATEGEEMYWMAGLELASPWTIPQWQLRAEYGLAGGELAPGITHRAAVSGEWRELALLSIGAAVEPDGGARSITPVGAASVRLNRYRLGVVREQLPNGFGGAYSFRFSVTF